MSFLLFSQMLLLLCGCTEFKDDNPLDVSGTEYRQSYCELTIRADSVRIVTIGDASKDTLDKYLAQETELDGRTKSYKFWTHNKNRLALKYKNAIIAGDSQAVNIVNLKTERTRGWLMIDSTVAQNKLTLSWWRQPDTTWLADFEIFKNRRDKFGGLIGVWERYPNDPTQGAHEFDALNAGYNGRNCLGIDYDVDSSNPAICGLFFKLSPDINGTANLSDSSKYQYISLFIRGDPDSGFTTKLQIELKGPEPPDFNSDWKKQEARRYIITNIESRWKQLIISLADFVPWPEHVNLESLEAIHEFTITFVDKDVDPDAKDGIIYVDDIFFLDSLPYGFKKGWTILGSN